MSISTLKTGALRVTRYNPETWKLKKRAGETFIGLVPPGVGVDQLHQVPIWVELTEAERAKVRLAVEKRTADAQAAADQASLEVLASTIAGARRAIQRASGLPSSVDSAAVWTELRTLAYQLKSLGIARPSSRVKSAT